MNITPSERNATSLTWVDHTVSGTPPSLTTVGPSMNSPDTASTRAMLTSVVSLRS